MPSARICDTSGCSRSHVAKGLCRSCYSNEYTKQRKRAINDANVRVCALNECGKSFSGKDRRAIFCSRPCKERSRGIRRNEQRVPVSTTRPPRDCVECGGPIASERQGQAKYCGQMCNKRAHERRKRLARNESLDRRCETCGEAIDLLAMLGTVYCSVECRKLAGRARVYSITAHELWQLWQDCGGRCPICDRDLTLNSRDAHVDHDHATGKVRGLLCFGCNPGLGNFQEDPMFLRNAADYLDRHAKEV